MWKRLQQSKTARQVTIGDPLLIETTLDENAYGLAQSNLRDIERSPPSGAVFPSRPALPQEGLSSFQFKPLHSNPYSSSASERPPPSIYSANAPHNRYPRRPAALAAKVYGEEVEISPPSSPDIETPASARRFSPYDDAEVSPVDEVPDVSALHRGRPEPTSNPRSAASNIPVLRREKRRSSMGVRKINQTSTNTRWDTMTGEPTISDRGLPQQVKPSEFVPPSGRQGDNDEEGAARKAVAASTSTAINQASFGERVRKMKESNVMPGNRPEWKGSSGRATIVPPVADQPDIPPLNIPRKSSKRTGSPRVAEWKDSGASSAPVSAVRAGPIETSAASLSASSSPNARMTRPAMPSQDRDVRDASRSFTTPTASPSALDPSSQSHPSSAVSGHRSPDNYTTKALPSSGREGSFAALNECNAVQKQESTSTTERNFREALKDLNIPTPINDQPVSRFSVTTYATTTADSTPRASLEAAPPMPTPLNPPSPIVNRSRPKVGGSLDASKATARKAVPNSPVLLSMSSGQAQSRHNSKMLPKSPAEAASVDPISSLQAQLDNLRHRRTNLERGIHQMTELMPADALARGMEARRQAEEKKKVEILREDLADIIREEHELGLRLHRAYKRMDQEATYEPTTLWVRRITG